MAGAWRGRAGMAVLAFSVLAFGGALGGCELLYFAGVKSTAPAAYKFPKGQHVLVLVELRDGVGAPPAYPTELADKIGGRLWQAKSIDQPPLAQDLVIGLRQANPEAYRKMGLADIAQDTGADLILRVYITQLQTTATADGTVANGKLEAYVKIVDKKGDRIWPGDVTGKPLNAHLEMAYLADRGMPEILKNLSGQLMDQIDALFRETPNDARHASQ